MAEARVVAEVAQVVEGCVGVFDGYFDAGRVLQEGGCGGVVEVCAVAGALVGGEDEELGDARAVGERGDGEGGGGGEGELCCGC